MIIDTTNLTPRNLKLRINKFFGHGEGSNFYVEVMSFGFKYGLPLDADIVMDVRFLPNPFYIPELKHQTGNDRAVQEYVMKSADAQKFYQHLSALIKGALPGYIHEGKSSLTIAIGCTGASIGRLPLLTAWLMTFEIVTIGSIFTTVTLIRPNRKEDGVYVS